MIMLLRFASNKWFTLDLYLRKTSKIESKDPSQAKVDTSISRRVVYALISRDNYDKFGEPGTQSHQHHPINEPGSETQKNICNFRRIFGRSCWSIIAYNPMLTDLKSSLYRCFSFSSHNAKESATVSTSDLLHLSEFLSKHFVFLRPAIKRYSRYSNSFSNKVKTLTLIHHRNSNTSFIRSIF